MPRQATWAPGKPGHPQQQPRGHSAAEAPACCREAREERLGVSVLSCLISSWKLLWTIPTKDQNVQQRGQAGVGGDVLGCRTGGIMDLGDVTWVSCVLPKG